jgi:hypothetical protein
LKESLEKFSGHGRKKVPIMSILRKWKTNTRTQKEITSHCHLF